MRVVNVAVEPRIARDAEKLLAALSTLIGEDDTLSFYADLETGQVILEGTSEAHLDGALDLLRSFYGLDINIGSMQVGYLETLGARAEVKCAHKRQTAGYGQFAEVKIVFKPGEWNTGIVFEDKSAGAVPCAYIAAIEKGVRIAAQTGVQAGFPTVDFKFTLIDGKYHDVDSSALAFDIAAKACFRELGKTEAPRILEPVMIVEIATPSAYARKIISDLKARMCRIGSCETRGGMEFITASVALKMMLGYGDVLSDLSEAQAKFTMHYERHQEVPRGEPPDDLFPQAMAIRA